MKNVHWFQRALSMVLAAALFFSFLPHPVLAETEPTVNTESSTETAVPAEEETVPSEETTAPTEAVTEPSEEPTVPTEAVTEPTGETTSPTEAETEPPEETTSPTEAVTEPPEETTAPTEAEPEPAALEPEAPVFRRIRSLTQLTTGQYVPVTASGYAPLKLEGKWLPAAAPTAEGDAITDPQEAIWTLTVSSDGTVILTDSSSTAISPQNDGQNGITSGEYGWQVSCADGWFSFHGTSGEEAVTLAANPTVDFAFRAFLDSTIAADPANYPTAFALYRLEAEEETEEEPEKQSILSIAHAKALAEGTEAVTIQGTVTLADADCFVIEDASGGMALEFESLPQAGLGDILLVTGTRTGEAGLSVTCWEVTGTAPLPTAETALFAVWDPSLRYTRVYISAAVLGEGFLIQNDTSVPLSGPLPAEVRAGDTVNAYAVVLGDQLRIAHESHVTKVNTREWVTWHAVELEDIRPTDTVAVTMTQNGTAWALSSADGSSSAPAAVEVRIDGGIMQSTEENLSWILTVSDQGMTLSAMNGSGYLYTTDDNNGVRAGGSEGNLWCVEDGYLKHLGTNRYLSVHEGAYWRALLHHAGPAAGQTLQFWRLETAEPVTALPEDGSLPFGDSITLSCGSDGAAIYYATSFDGETYSEFALYTQPITPAEGFGTLSVRAYAVKEGCLDSPEQTFVFTECPKLDWNLYFGLLHAHSLISGSAATVEAVFQAAANTEGLDFFAVTDHSNSFDNADSGVISWDGTAVSSHWAAGKAAAEAVTGEDFVGIFGYEMTWQEGKHLGHINTFNTPGWQSRTQPEYSDPTIALENYYSALTTVPGSVSQFNHPGTTYGEFEAFAHYSAAYDNAIQLLEVGSGKTACGYYIQALDAGWHVAPTNNKNVYNGTSGKAYTARTVVLAEKLTEESLYDAMRRYRVYATEDSDLTIYYTLNDALMGSILSGAESAQIRVYLQDPTDAAIGTVEVLADGGTVLASRTVETPADTLEISVPTEYSYYFLRVTQPDGDIAVTAPVWVERYEDLGITAFTADTDLPVQDQPLCLTLELFNDENVDFTLESIVFSANGQVIYTAKEPGTVPASGTLSHTCTYTHSGLGVTEFQAVVTGRIHGQIRTYETALTLRYRSGALVSHILVDGSHGNFGTGTLSRLSAVASDAHVGVTILTETITETQLEGGNVLIISAPGTAFDGEFLELAAAFVKRGGTLVVCGRSDAADGPVHAASELNRLLSAVGSSLRLNDDTAVDPVNKGTKADQLYPAVFNTASKWCADITEQQFYSQNSGCTVDPGSGTWLVKGFDTTTSEDRDGDGLSGSGQVLLACEDTAFGGTIFAAGSLFLSDEAMPAQKNFWDPPRINQSILEEILNIEKVSWPLLDIGDVRKGEIGSVYRIQGYVTAGTSNPYNIFPETLYVQDDTGGIAVIPFTDTGIQVGTPMEVIGYLDVQNGNPVLRLIGYEVLEEDYYRYVPKTTAVSKATDYETNGSRLVQVEGKVVNVTYTSDKKGISRLTLKDSSGTATVFIEEGIFSGATGENTLAAQIKKGRTVRAMGILWLDETGETVIRVRNCDEVVYIPPVRTPNTGDYIFLAVAGLVTSFAALMTLLILWKKRKK